MDWVNWMMLIEAILQMINQVPKILSQFFRFMYSTVVVNVCKIYVFACAV